MSTRSKRSKVGRGRADRPEQTSIAVWIPTKKLLDKIQTKLDAGSGVKALDTVVREQASRLNIPFVVSENGIASPA